MGVGGFVCRDFAVTGFYGKRIYLRFLPCLPRLTTFSLKERKIDIESRYRGL